MTAAVEVWTPLAGLSRRDLPGRGVGPGVYTIRARVTGLVLYIGQSGDVGRRMRDYFDGGVSTRGRIHELLYGKPRFADEVEVLIEPARSPRALEQLRLQQHRDHFGDLPPWNLRP